MLKPANLRCEYLVNPLGIDTRTPRLSWMVESDENGQVESDATVLIPYAGCELRSGQRVYGQGQAWDRDGNAAGTSDIARFETGLVAPADRQAHWVSGGLTVCDAGLLS